VPALPVVDTLKRTSDDLLVTATLDRQHVWRAQTPQGFPRELLDRAYADAHAAQFTATDDAALVERLGQPVQIVAGSERAMKITEERDFARAEAMWQGLRGGEGVPG
jgi:2-C-methyl-D-erythritol 4-phosphate cytidylyltransferase